MGYPVDRLTKNPERSEYFLAGLKEGGASMVLSASTSINKQHIN